jgi:hypothetical protein
MAQCTPWALVVIAAIATTLSQAALGDVDLDERCEPDGLAASMYATVSPERFWSNQLKEINEELAAEQRWPEEQERLRREARQVGAEAVAEADRVMEEVYRQYPQLRPSPAQQQAETLRRMADQLEHANHLPLREDWAYFAQARAYKCTFSWSNDCPPPPYAECWKSGSCPSDADPAAECWTMSYDPK